MTYPGLMLLIGAGVGLATFLYYMFLENRENSQQQQRYSYSSSIGFSSKRREFVINTEDAINCSICQYELHGSDMSQLYPCRHNFHKDCITVLKRHDPTASCPNCRTTIEYMT